MVDDEWDAFDAPSEDASEKESYSSPVDESRAASLAEEYSHLEAVNAETKARMEMIVDELSRMFPETEGAMSREAGSYTITIKRDERWVWDKEILAEMFGDDDLPPYVKRTLSVDKRKFERLKTSEQDQLKPALTRKLAKPKIEVIQNV